jgi:hypothetical protein
VVTFVPTRYKRNKIDVTLSFILKNAGKGEAYGFEYTSGIKKMTSLLLDRLLNAQLITSK